MAQHHHPQSQRRTRTTTKSQLLSLKRAQHRRKKEEKSWLLPVTLHSSLCCLENKTFNYCFSVSVLGFCLLRNFFLVHQTGHCVTVSDDCTSSPASSMWNAKPVLFFSLVHNCSVRHVQSKCFVHSPMHFAVLLWLNCLLFHCCTLFSFWCGALCSLFWILFPCTSLMVIMIALLCFALWRYFKILFSMAENWISKRKGVEVPFVSPFLWDGGWCRWTISSTLLHWWQLLFFVRLPLQKIPKDRKNLMHLFCGLVFAILTRKFYMDLATWVLFPRLLLDPYQVLLLPPLLDGLSILTLGGSLSFPPFIDNQSQFSLGNLFLPCLFIVVNGLWEILSTCDFGPLRVSRMTLPFLNSRIKQILCDLQLCVFE